MLDHAPVRGDLRHRSGGTDPGTLWSNVDAVVEETREADQPLGPAYIFLQELHHVGAAGDVFRRRVVAAGLGAKGERSGEVSWTYKRERMHRFNLPEPNR